MATEIRPGYAGRMNELEEGRALQLDFAKLRKVAGTGQEVLPVVLQNVDTAEVLFIGYANERALDESLRTRTAVLWSTSRNELWAKGASSGDVLDLLEIRVNCEQNSLLYCVRPRGGVCHTRTADGRTRPGCYYRRLTERGDALEPV
ncbi:MAG: phosphoribosyl-AMP cyclohydrolase [Myxococcota bacterium]